MGMDCCLGRGGANEHEASRRIKSEFLVQVQPPLHTHCQRAESTRNQASRREKERVRAGMLVRECGVLEGSSLELRLSTCFYLSRVSCSLFHLSVSRVLLIVSPLCLAQALHLFLCVSRFYLSRICLLSHACLLSHICLLFHIPHPFLHILVCRYSLSADTPCLQILLVCR